MELLLEDNKSGLKSPFNARQKLKIANETIDLVNKDMLKRYYISILMEKNNEFVLG